MYSSNSPFSIRSSKSFFLALSRLMTSWKFWAKSFIIVSQIHSSISLPPVWRCWSSCTDIFLIQRCILDPLRYPKKSMVRDIGLCMTLVCLLIPWYTLQLVMNSSTLSRSPVRFLVPSRSSCPIMPLGRLRFRCLPDQVRLRHHFLHLGWGHLHLHHLLTLLPCAFQYLVGEVQEDHLHLHLLYCGARGKASGGFLRCWWCFLFGILQFPRFGPPGCW